LNVKVSLILALIIGIIIGLVLNPYLQTPLNNNDKIFPYKITFQERQCGPYGFGYDFYINLDGSATLDSGEGIVSFDYSMKSNGNDPKVHSNLILTKSDFNEINSLLLIANILSLNSAYDWKERTFDVCRNKLTITINDLVKTVEWTDKIGADESTPEILFDIAQFFENRVPNKHYTR